jgi:hypothetical protein
MSCEEGGVVVGRGRGRVEDANAMGEEKGERRGD